MNDFLKCINKPIVLDDAGIERLEWCCKHPTKFPRPAGKCRRCSGHGVILTNDLTKAEETACPNCNGTGNDANEKGSITIPHYHSKVL